MAHRFGEARPQWWPALLLLAGISGLLPVPWLRRMHGLAADLLLSAARWVDPHAFASDARPVERVALAATTAGPDARVRSLLERARASVLPPEDRGWQRDGTFHVVPVGSVRSSEQLSLLIASAIPPGEPAFLGDVLVGFTPEPGPGEKGAREARKGPRVLPLLAPGTRLAASAGVRGQREVRFLAIGDGSDTLRVAYADSTVPIEEGDAVWAIDPPPTSPGPVKCLVHGATLGRIERGRLPPGADRIEWRVRPAFKLAEMTEVAVRHPPGFPGPEQTDLLPLTTRPLALPRLDARRSLFALPVGRELGVVPGSAVAAGPVLVGIVERAGWQRALVRRLADPGMRLRVLLLVDGRTFPWSLEVESARGDSLVLRGRPPFPDCDGALVVTAADPEGISEGLVVGTLFDLPAGCLLHLEPADLAEVAVERPPGLWSAGE